MDRNPRSRALRDDTGRPGVTGIVVHGLFALVGLFPEGAKDLDELARFEIDYTFWLNLLALVVAAAMLVLSRTGGRQDQSDRAEQTSA